MPVTAITEAVYARALSACKDQRTRPRQGPAGPQPAATGTREGFVDAVRDALYASKVVAYAQGFEQMRAGRRGDGWNVDPGTLATIWRGGCIIRARFLDRIKEAYDADPDAAQPAAGRLLPRRGRPRRRTPGATWSRTAVDSACRCPRSRSSLAYYDGFRRERGPANLIQAQRDYFGAHTYRRVDRDGAFHTLWSEDGREVSAG